MVDSCLFGPDVISIINTSHWLSPCYVPHTIQASSLAMPPLVFHYSLIKCDYLPSLSSGGEKMGLAQRFTISEWQNQDLKPSWLAQCQLRCFRLQLRETTQVSGYISCHRKGSSEIRWGQGWELQDQQYHQKLRFSPWFCSILLRLVPPCCCRMAASSHADSCWFLFT